MRDILARYGIYGGVDILVDRMPLGYADVKEYPAMLVAGVEIYPRQRPMEFNTTRFGVSIMSEGGNSFQSRPLVVIWTHIP